MKDLVSNQSIPIDIILSRHTKSMIEAEIDAFMKGITYKKVRSNSGYNLSLGNLEIPYATVYDDDEIFKIIKNMVVNHFGISWTKIISRSREKEIVWARQVIHSLTYNFTDLTTAEVGAKIGGVDYSTVIYSKKTVKNRISTSKRDSIDYSTLSTQIKNTINTRDVNESKNSIRPNN